MSQHDLHYRYIYCCCCFLVFLVFATERSQRTAAHENKFKVEAYFWLLVRFLLGGTLKE
jgi:hypothetical protein